MDRRSTTDNTGLAKLLVQGLIEAMFFVSSSVLIDSEVLRMSPHRKARNRYGTLRNKDNDTKFYRIFIL